MKQNSKRRAFTVVELVIVIAVIAILAAALIPTFASLVKNANYNVDIQTANTLNKLLAVYVVDNKIESESDLRDAINATMGAGYYETMAPKSANYGYHFWYDISTNQYVVKRVEELPQAVVYAKRTMLTTDAMTRNANTDWKENNHFRLYNGYFMSDRGGSDLGKALAKLDNLDGSNHTYTDVVTELANMSGNSFAATAVNKLTNTAIIANGTFVAYANNPIHHVYVSLTATEILATNTKINNQISLEVLIPSNITKINTYAFEFSESSVLHINATEEKLGEMLSADCMIGSTITLSGVSGYKVEDTTVKRPDNSVLTNNLSISESAKVTDMEFDGEKTDKVYFDHINNKLYVAVDYTGKTTLSVYQYYGADGSTVAAKGETWSVEGNITYTNGKFEVTGFANTKEAHAGTITVKIQDVEKTIEVYGVKVENISVNGYQNLGLNIRYEDRVSNDQYTAVITLPYAPSSDSNTWAFIPNIVTNHPDIDVMPTGEIEFSGFEGMIYENNALKIREEYGENTIFTPSITFKYSAEGFDSVSSKVTYKFTLINSEDISFDYSDIVLSVNDKLNSYVIGNANAFDLSYLFKPSKNIENQIVIVEVYGASTSPIKILNVSELSEDLILNDIDMSILEEDTNGNNLKIQIALAERVDEGSKTTYNKIGYHKELLVKLVKAHNVTKDNVDSIPSGENQSIVLLSDVTIQDEKVFKNIDGNLHRLYAPSQFTKKTSTYWKAFITLHGEMKDTLVIGPTYDTVDMYNEITALVSNHEKAWDGVMLLGSECKITNSYLYGFRAPISSTGAEAIIKDSTIEGGSLANIHIAGKKLTLENVSLVQDKSGYTSTFNDTVKVYGMGIYSDNGANCELVIKGTTKQYTWISLKDADAISSGGDYEGTKITATMVVEQMLNNGDEFVHYTADDSKTKYINTGIVRDTSKVLEGWSLKQYKLVVTDETGTYTKGSKTFSYLTTKYEGYSYATCAAKVGSDVHPFLPAGWEHQNENHSEQYLASRVLSSNSAN